jgi:hypothetical protein
VSGSALIFRATLTMRRMVYVRKRDVRRGVKPDCGGRTSLAM